VKLGTKLSVAYFDQLRAQLNEEATLIDTISQGSDFIDIGGVRKHVISYLGDFLFAPERARSPVKSLSGGERNRLLLARLVYPSRPTCWCWTNRLTTSISKRWNCWKNCWRNYDGTLFLVSHDRSFLDNVVTQVIAFEGDGKLMEYVGGYEDWVRVKKYEASQSAATKAVATPPKGAAKTETPKKSSAKLSFKEQKELEDIPLRIEKLEREQEELTAALGAGNLFRDNPSHAKQLQERAAVIEDELLQLMARWEALEAK
jgi:ATP-binding cassette subfamily F protein uup